MMFFLRQGFFRIEHKMINYKFLCILIFWFVFLQNYIKDIMEMDWSDWDLIDGFDVVAKVYLVYNFNVINTQKYFVSAICHKLYTH